MSFSLGDLSTGRNTIGRLKLHFEESVDEEWFHFEERVDEEWFLWTNIQKAAVVPLAQARQFMHPQLSTYRNGIWFAMLELMTSNRRLQLVVAF